MLFEIHSEGKIAFKRLSDADLKRSPFSHQTHIGLSNDSLTFMPDNKMEYNAMLIYNSYCDIISCEVGKILRKSGRWDAPNIKTGSSNGDSVVRKIRAFAKEQESIPFYLLWFGLDSGTPVFWLVSQGSYDYGVLNQFCHFNTLGSTEIRIVHTGQVHFSDILGFIRMRLENASVNLQKDLELTAEIESDNPKFKDSDVKKAKSYIQDLGRRGEEIINAFLEKEKFEKRVDDFEWSNKSSEVGKPFDFWIHYASGQEQWMDVKTTEHEFEQAIIVSKNEIRFIAEKKNPEYAIYRVYSKAETEARLKICTGCLRYIQKLQRDIDYMTQSMSDYKAGIVNYKIAFEPGLHSFNQISDEIRLSS